MSPQTALWMLLLISVVSTAMVAPLGWEIREEIKRAKKNLSSYVATGVLNVVLRVAAIGLWWYYALQTDQVLLAVIPTIAGVWGWCMNMLLRLAKTKP